MASIIKSEKDLFELTSKSQSNPDLCSPLSGDTFKIKPYLTRQRKNLSIKSEKHWSLKDESEDY